MKKEKTNLDKAIEGVVLGTATKEQAELYKKTYPDFQVCGEVIPVYIPQRGKTVDMVILYRTSPGFYLATVRTCGAIVAYEVAFNIDTAQYVAFWRVTKPFKPY